MITYDHSINQVTILFWYINCVYRKKKTKKLTRERRDKAQAAARYFWIEVFSDLTYDASTPLSSLVYGPNPKRQDGFGIKEKANLNWCNGRDRGNGPKDLSTSHDSGRPVSLKRARTRLAFFLLCGLGGWGEFSSNPVGLDWIGLGWDVCLNIWARVGLGSGLVHYTVCSSAGTQKRLLQIPACTVYMSVESN